MVTRSSLCSHIHLKSRIREEPLAVDRIKAFIQRVREHLITHPDCRRQYYGVGPGSYLPSARHVL